MEKISGIIPTNSRVTSVDLKDSSPVRPGTPSFGRNESKPLQGATLQSSRGTNGDLAPKALSEQAKLADWRSKDADQAQVVQDLADKFFKTGPSNLSGPEQKTSGSGNKPIEAFGYSGKLGASRESKPTGFADRGLFAPSPSDREAEFEAQLRAQFDKSKDMRPISAQDRISSSLIAQAEPSIISVKDLGPMAAERQADKLESGRTMQEASDAPAGKKDEFYPRGSFIDFNA